MLTLLVLLPFIIRDLDECGLQIILLLLCSLAAAAFQRRRMVLSGFWLAAAATYKATPLLFLPFLLWKRQWKAAGCMVFFIAALNLLPATYLGWEKTLAENRHWFTYTLSVARDTPDAYPSVPRWETPKHQNLSLSATFARLVETYPPGHPLFIDHALVFPIRRPIDGTGKTGRHVAHRRAGCGGSVAYATPVFDGPRRSIDQHRLVCRDASFARFCPRSAGDSTSCCSFRPCCYWRTRCCRDERFRSGE